MTLRSTQAPGRSRVSAPATEPGCCHTDLVSSTKTVVGLFSTSIAFRQLLVWLVLLIAIVQFAGPIQAAVGQQATLQQLRDEVAERKAALTELKDRERKLKDPEYVKILARARLHFVMPNEQAYIVLGGESDTGTQLPLNTDVVAAAAQQPWWQTLHETMAAAPSADAR